MVCSGQKMREEQGAVGAEVEIAGVECFPILRGEGIAEAEMNFEIECTVTEITEIG